MYFSGFRDSYPMPSEPFLQIIEHRETITRLKLHIRLAEEKKLGRVWASDLYPTYTLTELENKWKELEKLTKSLFATSDSVLPFPKPPKLPKQPRKKRRVFTV